MASGLENIETVESPFRRFVTTIGVFPTAFTDAMTYYECLAYLVKYMEDTLIPAINENAEAVEELQGLYIQLKAFVDNYFDNLDVQEEINNKLDEMVDDGTLPEIITTYIQANVAWTFDTVADMKTATNLIDGSYAQTLGYTSINDGGGAIYKISATGTANEMDVIAVGSLFATIMPTTYITPEMFGAKGDGTTDDSNAIEVALTYIKSKNIILKLNKSYNITREITIANADKITIIGEGATLNVNAIPALYFNKINKLVIKGLSVEGTLSSGTPVAGLVHTLEAKDIEVSDIKGHQLGYVLKTDYVLTNDDNQFIADSVKFTNITGTDCELLLLTNFTKQLIVENIVNYSPNSKSRELFYLQGGIVDAYFRNITADTLVRWPFHFNVTNTGGINWNFTVEHNKNQNCYIDNLVIGSAQCLLHFTSYCVNVYLNNAKSASPVYEGTSGYTCENVFVSNSDVKMISGSSASTVNYVRITDSKIFGNTASTVNTKIEMDNCTWTTDITTNVFFIYITSGKMTVKNCTLVNASETAQQCFQTNSGAELELINNRVLLNRGNRLVAIVNASDKVTIKGNLCDATTSLGGIYTGTGTPYIVADNYINGSLQS